MFPPPSDELWEHILRLMACDLWNYLRSKLFNKFGYSLLFNVPVTMLLLFHAIMLQYDLGILHDFWLTPTCGGNYRGHNLLKCSAFFRGRRVSKM